MSTANDIRYAASFDEPLGLDEVACEIMWEFSTDYEGQFKDNDHERTFMLFVAEALDGGERKPLEGDEFIDMLLDNAGDPASLMREVEEFHGIG